MRIAVGLKVGVNVCEPKSSDASALSRPMVLVVFPAHWDRLESPDLICSGLSREGFPGVKEPPDLTERMGKT